MKNDIPCPICAANVPLQVQQAGLEVKCPSCQGKFLLTDELIGGKDKRPTFRPAPRRQESQRAGTRQAVPPALKDRAPRPDSAPSSASRLPTALPEVQRPQRRLANLLVAPRTSLAASLLWFIPAWVLACWAPRLSLSAPAVDTLLSFLCPAMTVLLGAWNFVVGMVLIRRSGRALTAVPTMLGQVVLAALLFFQINAHGGAEHFVGTHPPGPADWAGLAVGQALRSADILDGIEAYGLSLENLRSESMVASLALLLLHISIASFSVLLILELVNRLRRWLLPDANKLLVARVAGGIVALLLLFAWLATAMFSSPAWQGAHVLALLPDHVLRAIDVFDLADISGLALHQIPPDPWVGSLSIITRLLILVLLTELVGNFSVTARLRYLGGFALGRDDLAELVAMHEADKASELGYLSAARLKAIDQPETKPSGEVPAWNSRGAWVVAGGLAAIALAVMFISPKSQLPVLELAERAVGESEEEARPALAALRRIGAETGEEAVQTLAERQTDLPVERRLDIIETFGCLGEPAAAPLGEILQTDATRQIRIAAVHALRHIGPAAVATLLAGIKHVESETADACRAAIIAGRQRSLRPLAEHVDETNVAEVVSLFDQINPYWVRAIAAKSANFAEVVKARRAGVALSAVSRGPTQLAALERLEQIGPLAAAEQHRLAPLLATSDFEVQLAALRVKMKFNSGDLAVDPQMFAMLKSALSSPDPKIRLAALDRLVAAELAPPLQAELDPHLLTLLADQDFAFAQRVLDQVLAKSPTDATRLAAYKTDVKPLVPGLAFLTLHNDLNARLWGLKLLVELGGEVAKSDSTPSQQGGVDNTSKVSTLVTQIVERYAAGAPEEKTLAGQALQAIDGDARFTGPALANRLGQAGESQLVAALKDAGDEDRKFALFALGSTSAALAGRTGEFNKGGIGGMGGPPGGLGSNSPSTAPDSVVEALVDEVASGDLLLNELALASLAKIDKTGQRTAAATRARYLGAATTTLSDLLHELNTLDSGSVAAGSRLAARLQLVRGLGQMGPAAKAAIDRLTPLAQSNNSELKAAVDLSLRQIRGESPLDAPGGPGSHQSRGEQLVERIRNGSKTERESAKEELAKLKSEALSRLDPLLRLIVGKESGSREAAAYILNRVDQDGVSAAGLLGASTTPPITDQPHESLLALFKTEPETRRFAARVLAELGEKPPVSAAALVDLLNEKDNDLRRDVFLTLSRFDPGGNNITNLLQARYGEEAHNRILPSFRDDDSRAQACLLNVFVNLHGANPAVKAVLAKALANSDRQVQATARAIMTSISPEDTLKLDADSYRQFLTQAAAAIERADQAKANEALEACPPALRGFEWRYLYRVAHAGEASLRPQPAAGSSAAAGRFPVELAKVPFRASIGAVQDVKFGPEMPVLEGGAAVDLGYAGDVLDGGLAASGGEGEVAIWSLARQQTREQFRADPTACSLEFDVTGGKLLSVGTLASAWTLPKAKRLGQAPLGKAKVHGGAFDASGSQAAMACGNHLKFWRGFSTGAAALDGATEPALAEVVDFAYGADGTYYLAALKNGSVARWPGLAQKPRYPCKLGEPIEAFAYSKDGNFLALAGQKNVKLWLIESDVLHEIPISIPAGAGQIRALEFSPSGTRLAAGSAGGKVIVWQPGDSGAPLVVLPVAKGPIRSLSFHSRNDLLALGAGENQVEVLNGLPIAGISEESSTSKFDFGRRPGTDFGPGGMSSGEEGPFGPPSGGSRGPGTRKTTGRPPKSSSKPRRPKKGEEFDPDSGDGGVPGSPGVGGMMEDDVLDEQAADRLDKMLASFDKDGDGVLSKAEARAARISNFDKLDTDMSGDLTWDELYEIVRKVKGRK